MLNPNYLELLASATETWLTVSLNKRQLLIAKLLQATSTVGWGWHLFVIASCQSQLLIAMYTKSRWLYFYLVNITKSYFRFSRLYFYCRIITGWDTSPRCQPSEQPKSLSTVMKMLPPPSLEWRSSARLVVAGRTEKTEQQN